MSTRPRKTNRKTPSKDVLPIGSQWDMWTITGPPEKRSGATCYPVRCQCGYERFHKATMLFCGRSKGCKRCTRQRVFLDIGQRWGTWTVTAEAPPSSRGRAQYTATCDCGVTKTAPVPDLLRNHACNACHGVSKRSDITGDVFGRLTAISFAYTRNNTAHWLMRCACTEGQTTIVGLSDLRRGKTQSCGCLHAERTSETSRARVEDLVGQRFDRLVVVRRDYRRRKWECLCDCTKLTYLTTTALKTGNTRSCGCLVRSSFAERLRTGTITIDYMDRRYSAKRRCEKYGVPYDHSVTMQALLKRDGPYCAHCGVDTTGFTRPHRNCAHIDHIVPLSRAREYNAEHGTTFGHTWDNVRILCQFHNGRKRDRLDGELRHIDAINAYRAETEIPCLF